MASLKHDTDNVVNLGKYTGDAKVLLCEAQRLADHLNHRQITLYHLSATIRAHCYAHNSIVRAKIKTLTTFNKDLIKQFYKAYPDKKEKEFLASRLATNEPAYMSKAMLHLMSFAEDKELVTTNVLLQELIYMGEKV